MDPIEISLILEKEKQKCLNVIQKYYEKNKNKDIEMLYKYLKTQYENCDDEYIKNTIKYDMDILESYVSDEVI
jgi:hypothetical protein